MAGRFWVETLGCPKNEVDSEKLVGTLVADGLAPAAAAGEADVVVVNTCAFVEEARAESVEAILALADHRAPGARLVVTGCLAERAGDELAEALPEVDVVAGFGVSPTAALAAVGAPIDGAPGAGAPIDGAPGAGAPIDGVQRAGAPIDGAEGAGAVPVALGAPRRRSVRPGDPGVPSIDLLRLARPAASAPWAYVKVAEGCDRACGFCAIPSFRGAQVSRSVDDVLAEVDALGAREVVLVAQDLASFGRDQGRGERALVPLVEAVADRVDRVRLLYLYPSELTDELVGAVLGTGVPYFDLSLQHVSRPLVRRMRRWGDGERFARRIAEIRAAEPDATLRSSFIVGYPGETEADHDELLAFLDDVRLDWCGFFPWSREEGTYAADLDGAVPDGLVAERLAEVRELQDRITAERRDALVGRTVEVLVDRPGVGRSHREAPEIDGVVDVPEHLAAGTMVDVEVVAAVGPDLVGEPVGVGRRSRTTPASGGSAA